ncbi:membrane protein insertion efficiency factor YidD [Methylopila sp. M107]|uniref:membrane protein insertion efficiency factor YidD n=1 Tax=Methylopila sp. M107 TaxID=1101190 RepID=UPI0003602DB8|nr:membrane protein insertion efficiency factor YidD [Methylopila sp. M107]
MTDGARRSQFGDLIGRAPALALRAPILAYRYSLSMLIGRKCRYLPTCSEFADEALARHGAWAGGWMAAGRVCRCHPWGGDGFDPVPAALPSGATWSRPWRYSRRAPSPVCEAVDA